jgi:hypothetical protein
MFKIDWKKWNEAVKEAEAKRDSVIVRRTAGLSPWSSKFIEVANQAHAEYQGIFTKLYSIRAMAHDRVHRKSARLTSYEYRKLGHAVSDELLFIDNGGTLVLPLTAEDQAKYVGDDWKQYERPEPAPALTVTEMLPAGTR